MEASSRRSEKKKKKKIQENTDTQKNKKLPNVWFSLKKSLSCKSDPSDVHDPRSRKQQLPIISTKRPTTFSGGFGGRSGCSKSIANLKDVIHGSQQRHLEHPPCSSPRSIGSSEFLNPITHEVILSTSTCELKITGATEYVGTLRPGTPVHYSSSRRSQASRKASSLVMVEKNREGLGFQQSRRERDSAIDGDNFYVSCHKCGEMFSKLEAAEVHHLTKHAVTELVEGDSSRKIVEIICRTSLLKTENQGRKIDRILKVHNMQKTLARFEEYRDTVKIRASKLQKKHPRCIADGNELLRFHGTTVACGLGIDGSTSLCSSAKCCVCWIIRNGFSAKREMNHGIGVYTASTSERAFESIKISDGGGCDRKALIVCRVIAGRVHRPVENVEEMSGFMSGFDSLAGKVELANVEELYLLSSRALLPCFVLICKN